MTMHNLARAYIGQNRWIEAKDLMVKMIEIQTRQFGAKHPDRLMAMVELARVNEHLEQTDEAKKLLSEAIKIMKEIMGLGHPRTQIAISRLAAIYKRQGFPGGAQELEFVHSASEA